VQNVLDLITNFDQTPIKICEGEIFTW